MYTTVDFKTKKAFKEAFKAGDIIDVYEPGPFPGKMIGEVSIEGPHYPQPHTWYARVQIEDGRVVKIIS